MVAATMTAKSAARAGAAADAVFSTADLVALIFTGRIGLWQFVQVAQVNTVCRDVCATNQHFLRAVVVYSGGLTLPDFSNLLCLVDRETRQLHRERVGRYELFAGRAFDAMTANLKTTLRERRVANGGIVRDEDKRRRLAYELRGWRAEPQYTRHSRDEYFARRKSSPRCSWHRVDEVLPPAIQL